VRSIELISGKNYWHAMENELFKPLGIKDALPGGTGFSAEDLARIGVLLHNGGTYGPQELFSEKTCKAILPTPLKPYFPNINMTYGIGLQNAAKKLGLGSYGHGGGGGTQLLVNPKKRFVFAMTRDAPGPDYGPRLKDILAHLRSWIND
ncbi:MAG: serine hydrolase, partial [Lentisphaerae bacterium]|nr:serine hydrolase [Lentisphaerota bacterium]